MGAACDLINLPGYIDLNPVTNPHEFHVAWDDLIVGIMDVLKYEAFTKDNIGLLETSLQRFYPNSATIDNHPFRQQTNESVSQWTARIANEERAVRAACHNANCLERCPTQMTMVSLLYACAHASIWPTAARLKQEQKIQVNNFRDAMYLLMNAEHQVTYQDPQITIANQIRAYIPASSIQNTLSVPTCPVQPPRLSTPTLPRIATPPVNVPPSSVPEPVNVPPSPVPDPLSTEIDQHPEMQAFRKCFVAEKPLAERPTLTLNQKTYYVLPPALPKPSKSFHKGLAASSCTNCGNADALFPHHTWHKCPFYTPPHRFSLWPQHHSPIKSIADGGVSSLPPTDQPGSDSPNLLTCSNLLIPKAPAQSVGTVEFPEPPPYRGTVCTINRGISDRERGEMHLFPVLISALQPQPTNRGAVAETS